MPCALLFAALLAPALPPGIEVRPGAVNQVLIGGKVAIYGGASAGALLYTHARRDVLPLSPPAARAYAPAAERELFESPSKFWQSFETSRFHDYAQQTTKVPVTPTPVHRFVKGGDHIEENGFRFDVLDTPGYSPGAVSYVLETGGKRIAFTGDLIYGDGQLLDLYSLQDAIPDTKTRGYHGYAARAGKLMDSLRRVAALNPDILIPARGPVIANPRDSIQLLLTRLQAILQSHFSTDALRWYWGYESLRQRARYTGLLNGVDEVMPFAEERRLPPWVIPIGNSRLILSRSGAAFLVDSGYRGIQDELASLRSAGRFQRLEGIWITHYHDDHTDFAQQVSDAYDAPVNAIASMRDILLSPASYRMPCLTPNPITSLTARADRESLRWHEFELRFYDFPGQTLYHGGLRVIPPEGDALFFAGDSFTPAGMDDYCLQNRDLVREGKGFSYCLNLLDQLHADWIINQHVDPMFRYSKANLAFMRREAQKRAALLEQITPLPGADFAVDESWARFYPYTVDVRPGTPLHLELRIVNHANTPRDFHVTWNLPNALKSTAAPWTLTIPAAAEGRASLDLTPREPGLHLVTANLSTGSFQLNAWTEAMIRVR